MSSKVTAAGTRGRKRLEQRLRRPHILTEIVKTGLALSGKAQADFIDVLETTSDTFRNLLVDATLICKSEVNHKATWQAVRGLRIGFVDGGVANVSSLGAAPVAIRVGSYVVVPGSGGPERESFDFEVQLVDELYQSAATKSGVYDDLFDDPAKLRDAARIACEMGGILSLLKKQQSPDVVLLHGPLVNPVSPYALGRPGDPDAFPNFTEATLSKLLAGVDYVRTGRDANFISVYLEQLSRMVKSNKTVCGVVERAASRAPGILTKAVLQRLKDDNLIDLTSQRQFLDSMYQYSIGDTVLFECVLDEGEYVRPIEVDKQEKSKIPVHWDAEIQSYPKPLITYAKAHSDMMPIRIEVLMGKVLDANQIINLIIHMSRLLPRYSFPVGLDIVDKHTKVPEWMSKQMNVMLSAQLLRKALEGGNPATIRMVKRMLSTNARDWLFRPDFKKGAN